MNRAPRYTPAPRTEQEVARRLTHEVGPRWLELAGRTTSAAASLIFELKEMRRVRIRVIYTDGSESLNPATLEEVPDARRFVEIPDGSEAHVLRDGQRFYKNVRITHRGSAEVFIGQISFHTDRHVSLTGYHH